MDNKEMLETLQHLKVQLDALIWMMNAEILRPMNPEEQERFKKAFPHADFVVGDFMVKRIQPDYPL